MLLSGPLRNPGLRFTPLFAVLVSLVCACSGERYNELMNASRDGNLEAVKRALQRGIEINQRTSQGKTALMLAAANGQTETVTWLISHGADVKIEDNYGTSAIITAATAGKNEVVSLLLNSGADPIKRDSSGGSALENATFFGHTSTVLALLPHTKDLPVDQAGELLLVAAGLGHIDIVRAYLDYGIDVNSTGVKQRTALMAAAAFNQKAVAELLLARGANPKLKDKDGYDALHVARGEGHDDLVALLETR